MVGVAALLLSRGIATAAEVATVIPSFRGVTRRLDRKSEKTTVPIFEGFGSSHEKAKSAIAAMKLHFPRRRLIVLFEPYTFSWRNRNAIAWYDDVFAGADKVLIFKPTEMGSTTHAQLSHDEIVARVRAGGIDAETIGEAGKAEAMFETMLRPDDAILFLTSGNLGGLIGTIPKIAEAKFPK
jgi:UDP-N-acetylmuramate: L-alanyl-gamma-D-glutamyl-meso-diaminopimelate ligase